MAEVIDEARFLSEALGLNLSNTELNIIASGGQVTLTKKPADFLVHVIQLSFLSKVKTEVDNLLNSLEALKLNTQIETLENLRIFTKKANLAASIREEMLSGMENSSKNLSEDFKENIQSLGNAITNQALDATETFSVSSSLLQTIGNPTSVSFHRRLGNQEDAQPCLYFFDHCFCFLIRAEAE